MKTKLSYEFELAAGGSVNCDLPYKMDCIMDYKDVLKLEGPDRITIGYLAHDDDCPNPLTDCDGMGHIYDCRRHSRTLKDYEEALGLADGGRNLELVDEDAVVEEAHRRIFNDPDLEEKAVAHVRKHWDWSKAVSSIKFVKECLDSIDELCPIFDVDALQRELWKEGRQAGTIGNKHAVLLDIYEHGQVKYSVSGSGPQCDFDNARNGAVWVPDDICVDEIERRAIVYARGDIIEQKLRSKTQYGVRTFKQGGLVYDDQVHPTFGDWGAAFGYLSNIKAGFTRPTEHAQTAAAEELAKQAADSYTDWCNGNCFGVVVAHFDLDGTEIEHDACWGFVGDDDAYDSLKSDYFPDELPAAEPEPDFTGWPEPEVTIAAASAALAAADIASTLRKMLEDIVADAGACDDECYSVSTDLIDKAATYLKEHHDH